MKKVVITHAFGAQNRGDHELLSRLIEVVHIKHPGCNISVYTTFPEESRGKIDGCDSIKSSPFRRPKGFTDTLFFIWDAAFWVLSTHIRAFNIFMTKARRSGYLEIIDSDHVYMCPGGYMFSNGGSFYINLLNGYLFRRISHKVVASPMSIGPFDNRFDTVIAKAFLKNVSAVHVRESYSQQLLEQMGIDSIYTHDLAWYSKDDVVSDDYSWEGFYVGTVIDWKYNGRNYSEMRDRYIEQYLEAAEILHRDSGNPLVLYNQVGLGDGLSADEKLIAELVDKSKGIIRYDKTASTPDELKKKIKNSKGVLASRFHSALFSIQARVPFIAIAYQPKATFILKDLSLDKYGRSIESFSGIEVAKCLTAMSHKRDVVSDELQLAAEGAVLNIENTFIG